MGEASPPSLELLRHRLECGALQLCHWNAFELYWLHYKHNFVWLGASKIHLNSHVL